MANPKLRLALGTALLLLGCTEQQAPCSYPDGPCPDGRACGFVAEGRAECVSTLDLGRKVSIPLSPSEGVWCFQGGRSAAGRTHSWAGDLFAVDLASPAPGPVTVRAPASGIATVYDACEHRAEDATGKNNTRCGAGYGNHVRIWDGKHLWLLAHLAKATIADGSVVSAGAPIGIMGRSGAAGPRHLHLNVTRVPNKKNREKILENPGWKGEIPVRFEIDKMGWVEALTCSETAPPPEPVAELDPTDAPSKAL